MKRNVLASFTLGGIFLVCGISWLFANLFNWRVNFGLIWPLFLIIPGVSFFLYYFANGRKNHDQLFPAVILTVLGFTFLLNNTAEDLFNNDLMWTLTIFLYPGSVALAFWAVWLAGGRQFKHAFVAMILSAISLFLFCLFSLIAVVDTLFANTQLGRFVWPISLICVGFIVLFFPLASLANKDKEKSMAEAAKEMARKAKDLVTPVSSAEAQDAPVSQMDTTMAEEAEVVPPAVEPAEVESSEVGEPVPEPTSASAEAKENAEDFSSAQKVE